MPKAVWNGAVLAQSDKTHVVDGCHYFPPQSINHQYFFANNHHTICPRKGTATYFDIVVNYKVCPNAAWMFRTPNPVAAQLAGHFAFSSPVQIR